MSITVVMAVLYFIIFLMGVFAFSFINILINRIIAAIPIRYERSISPKCKHIRNKYDMISVISYLMQGDRFRFCKEKILARYLLLEIFGGFLAVLAVYWFGKLGNGGMREMFQAVLVFILLAILTVISFIDIEIMEIPNGLVIAVLACGIAASVLFPEPGIAARMIGSMAVSLPMGMLALCIAGAFGGGDIKLMAAAGIFLGWRGIWVAFIIAVLTGGIYGVYLLIAHKKERRSRFAFGPFLCIGIAMSVFVGEAVIHWYLV